MIRSLTVTNAQGETLTLELARPDISGIEVRKIEDVSSGENMSGSLVSTYPTTSATRLSV